MKQSIIICFFLISFVGGCCEDDIQPNGNFDLCLETNLNFKQQNKDFTDFKNNSVRWICNEIAHYQFIQRTSGARQFCISKIEVLNGSIVDSEIMDVSSAGDSLICVRQGNDTHMTIDGFFNLIEIAVDSSILIVLDGFENPIRVSESINIVYDSILNIPTLIALDYLTGTSGDEQVFKIVNFEILD